MLKTTSIPLISVLATPYSHPKAIFRNISNIGDLATHLVLAYLWSSLKPSMNDPWPSSQNVTYSESML